MLRIKTVVLAIAVMVVSLTAGGLIFSPGPKAEAGEEVAPRFRLRDNCNPLVVPKVDEESCEEGGKNPYEAIGHLV